MAEQQVPAVGGRGINPGSWVIRATEEEEADDVPEHWGWPPNPFPRDELSLHYDAMQALTPPKEVDPHCFDKGRWYVFPAGKDDESSSVYVHNYTKAIVSEPPKNFVELSGADQRRLGTPVLELPELLRRTWKVKRKIPLVYGSAALCHIMTTYSIYGMDAQLLDTTPLRRMSEKSLEEARFAIVNAMRYGKMLCIYIGDHICDFAEKVCVSKNKHKFPLATFQYGGLENEVIKDKIYQADDREGGQCVVRDGFMVFVLVAYDRDDFELSTSRRDELEPKIPNFQATEEVKCFCDEDKRNLLQRKQPPA
eukprot:TRINITY_DN10312_c0_g1_i1.p1 TRINITY_DN10312_c0_g1~~TRINITY_DN10312_c0_g1_i1.p1  ORF type:complete len:309 (+),score=102.82 TRINITY_DN10312_c0_g1_i1:56-982(+)